MDDESKKLLSLGLGVALPVAVAGAVAGYSLYGVGAAILGVVLAVVVATVAAGAILGLFEHRKTVASYALFLASYLAAVYVVSQYWSAQI